MVIPAAMQIESAIDTLKTVETDYLADQLKELHSAVGDKSDDFQAGYQLGLETARVMIATNVQIIQKGVKPESVL